LIIFFGILVLLFLIIASISRQSTGNKVAEAESHVAQSATNLDEAELLISNCGEPSKDDSTEYDQPRPIFPTRIIEYRAKKLRFIFAQGSGKVGDPPPYRWKLFGATDMTSRDPSRARPVQPDEIARRMPCWAGK
jgi:hypothetical protein